MDAKRFDALSRTFATPASRRHTVRALGVGGLLAAAFGRPSRILAQETTCELDIQLEPAPDSDAPALKGKLTLQIDEEGAIDDGVFETEDGDEFDVVGQATGRAISLFIELEDDDAVALTGVGERDVVLCRGAFAGTFGGPKLGDLGSWSTVRGNGRSDDDDDDSGAGNTGSNSGGGSSGGGGSSNNGGGNGEDSGGDSNCPSGVVCGGVCCEARAGFTPDQISCDGGFCACTYSCQSAGCDSGGTDNFFTVGCSDRPNALCGENCNFPSDNGCGDVFCNDGEELDLDSCTCFPVDGGGDGGGGSSLDDPNADTDGDGLTNGEEANIGTIPDAWDSDNDTLNDGEEVNSWGTNPMNRDSDGDLHNDNEEVTVGTDPWDPNSHL